MSNDDILEAVIIFISLGNWGTQSKNFKD